MGLERDLDLVGDNYQWLGSVFYFGGIALAQSKDFPSVLTCKGYLGWEYPANRLMQRLPLAKYSAFCIIMWGIVLSCFAAVKTFSKAVAIRLVMGILEASVTPGFALFTSQACRNPSATTFF